MQHAGSDARMPSHAGSEGVPALDEGRMPSFPGSTRALRAYQPLLLKFRR